MNKRGLVLEGGALRGLFSAGITDVMMLHNLRFDGIIGVSAGAAFGCNIKSHQPGRVLRYNKQMAHNWRYCSMRSLLLTGDLFGGEFCYHTLPEKIDVFDADTFKKDPAEFYAVVTDVATGKPVYKKIMEMNREANEWFRASASMPVAAKIVRIGGGLYLDGGVADSIPLEFFNRQGYRRCIVILTQPQGFVKEDNPMQPLMSFWLRRHKKFVEAMERRTEMYNRELEYVAREEQKGNCLVLRPKAKLPINHVCHDPLVMQQCYDLGSQLANELLAEIIDFMSHD